MDFDAEKRELKIALETLLKKADCLNLSMVGIYLSHALDALQEEDGVAPSPPPTGTQ